MLDLRLNLHCFHSISVTLELLQYFPLQAGINKKGLHVWLQVFVEASAVLSNGTVNIKYTRQNERP